jgi:LuxR family transcriptional regulator, maltose regulon positive regulatory protein
VLSARSPGVGVYQTILDEGDAEIGTLLATFQENATRSSQGADVWRFQTDGRLEVTLSIRAPASLNSDSNLCNFGAIECQRRGHTQVIAEGLPNKEIARNLAIAPETVKSHVKYIFTKLVKKRAQAGSRAQILGLTGAQH